MDKITFTTDSGSEEWYVLSQTRISGRNYLLVADTLDDDANAMILRDDSSEQDAVADYVPVEDGAELEAVADIFSEDLGDIDFE